MAYSFDAELFTWKSNPSWHFVNLPVDVSKEIQELAKDFKRGFGSVRVDILVGKTFWRTSIFPNNDEKCFILPVKKQVRVKEKLEIGQKIEFKVDLVDF